MADDSWGAGRLNHTRVGKGFGKNQPVLRSYVHGSYFRVNGINGTDGANDKVSNVYGSAVLSDYSTNGTHDIVGYIFGSSVYTVNGTNDYGRIVDGSVIFTVSGANATYDKVG
mmetsp:Transcript_128432/g.411728  ORF Transcript_128432/g.411728 Transcript_128432/m.411728 type:complete len:113 (+) Transcript_128432:366-704(+)